MSLRIATKKHTSKVEYKTGVNEMGLVYAEIELTSFDDIALHRRGFLEEDKIKKVKITVD